MIGAVIRCERGIIRFSENSGKIARVIVNAREHLHNANYMNHVRFEHRSAFSTRYQALGAERKRFDRI